MLGRTRTRHGLSIVEGLVALALLTFGLWVIFSQMTAADRLGEDRLHHLQARWLAAGQLEQLRACDYESLSRWPGDAEPVALGDGPHLPPSSGRARLPD